MLELYPELRQIVEVSIQEILQIVVQQMVVVEALLITYGNNQQVVHPQDFLLYRQLLQLPMILELLQRPHGIEEVQLVVYVVHIYIHHQLLRL